MPRLVNPYYLHLMNNYVLYFCVIVLAIGIVDKNIPSYLYLQMKLQWINTIMFFWKLRFKWFFFRQRFR